MAEARPYPREYALTRLAEELEVYATFPQLAWGALDAMTPAERETLVEHVRYREHRERQREELLLMMMRGGRKG